MLAFIVQANQLLSQYLSLRHIHESVLLPALFHREFPDLPSTQIPGRLDPIRRHQERGEHAQALAASRQLILQILAGIDYYQRYQRAILQLLISAAFLGSLATSLVVVLRMLTADCRQLTGSAMSRKPEGFLTVLFFAAWFCQRLPVHFVLYYLAPVYTVYRLRSELSCLSAASAWKAARRTGPMLVLAVVICETVVAAFFDRRALCLGLLLTAATFFM
jgi:hypothetical protein